MQINIVVIAGNLTRDPEVRYLPKGTAVASFSLAVNERYKSGDQIKENVSFVGCVAFGRTAELCVQYMAKGSPCVVIGRIRQESWTDNNGNKKSKTKVYADTVQFMRRGDKPAGESRAESAPPGPGVDEGRYQDDPSGGNWDE